jgi:hypothetical protein
MQTPEKLQQMYDMLYELGYQDQELQKKIDAVNSISVLFLVDVTGSMAGEIQSIKNQITALMQNIAEVINPSCPKFAFIGYRDINDAKRFEIFKAPSEEPIYFTEEPWEVINFLETVQATGGDDTPEDINGALVQALALPWDSRVRVIFHVFDAPPHGSIYHDCKDNFPTGGPDDRPLVDIFTEMKAKRIDYYMVPVRAELPKMLDHFNEAHKTACGRDLRANTFNVKNFDNHLIELVIKSIELSITGSNTEYLDRPLHRGPPSWNPAHCTRYGGTIKSKKNERPKEVNVEIMNDPFGSGSMRHAFYCRVLSGWGDPAKVYVAKQWKAISNSNPTNRCWEQVNCHNKMTELLEKFNRAAGEHLRCVPLYCLTVNDRDRTTYTLEEYIPGAFMKHNNNYNFVNRTALKILEMNCFKLFHTFAG